MDDRFDVAIIGGGISGCAAFYILSEYTDVKKVVIIEKCDKLATISSNAKANSQTIHDGSIETNYSVTKASKIKIAASKVKNYALSKNLQNKVIFNMQKMAIGVGDEECEFIKKRHEDFVKVFEDMQFFKKEEIKKLEPKVIEGSDYKDRVENVVASGYKESWCAVNFEKLSENFVEEGIKSNSNNKTILNFKVVDIKSNDDNSYTLISKDGRKIISNFILVNAGSYSLPLAQKMGYGLDLGCLPIAGSFYFAKDKLLNGKVYTVQNPKLPFASVHGDPDINKHGVTRLGPTAITIPKLERSKHLFGNLSSELIKIDFKLGTIKVGFDLMKDRDIRNYALKNILFEVPVLGKRLFTNEAKKIIPSLEARNIAYAKGYGEVRPQVIDMNEKKLELGEKKILTNKGITFNMTPSPGATSCMENAEIDVKEIVKYLNKTFDVERLYKDLSIDSNI